MKPPCIFKFRPLPRKRPCLEIPEKGEKLLRYLEVAAAVASMSSRQCHLIHGYLAVTFAGFVGAHAVLPVALMA
jgi:hypothetical protein